MSFLYKTLLTVIILSFTLTGKAQFSSDELKYVIILGDQVRMASDMIDRSSREDMKFGSNISRLELLSRADYQMSSGKEKSAIESYYGVLESFIDQPAASNDGEIKPVTVFTISANRDKRLTYAEELLRAVVDEERSKEDWFLISRALNAVAIYYHQQGNLKVAESLYLKTVELRGTYGSKTSEHYVNALHNLAVLRKDQGRYNAAEDIFNYVIRYIKSKRGENSGQYAIVRNNQAMLLSEIGRKGEGEQLIKNILASKDVILFSLSSNDLTRITMNYALLLLDDGQVENAYSTLNELKNSYSNEKRRKNNDLLISDLYRFKIELSISPETLSEDMVDALIKDIDKVYGSESLTYADGLVFRGDWQMARAQYGQSITSYDQAAVIKIKQLGQHHLDYLKIVNKQGQVYWKQQQFSNAYARFEVAAKAYLGIIDKFFYNMSEKEKFKFWQSISPEIDLLYMFASEHYTEIPQALELALEVRMLTKGLLLHNSNKILEIISENDDPELKIMYSNWVQLKKDLSTYYSISAEAIDEMKIDLVLLEEEANAIEKSINLKVSGSINEVMTPVSVNDIKSSLTGTEATIEIIRINYPLGRNHRYGAWVITNTSLNFKFIGQAEELEQKMIRYYKNMIRLKRPDTESYGAYWKPLEELTSGYKKLYVSLDGVYNLINLNSLARNNSFLIEEQIIEIVPNSAYVATAIEKPSFSGDALLLGNPSFSGTKISALPGTAIELTKIGDLLQSNSITAESYTGPLATEEVLKKSNNPRIVHIATHGFFIGDKPTKEAIIASESINSENPLLRSGLLLAGAGSTDRPVNSEKSDDGIFTAYDGMNLPLLKTELVVLSACETGTGEVVNGEGVYGLSRAFSVAGAQHVVLSLWKVDDTATQELMTLFYTNWLKGEEIKSALTSAQKSLKEKYPEPYYWAAFVMINNR